ncbi:biosynthetic arginine decarboxylase [Parathalassolituus penaei]|uniref:Arginine decarboxylase n=1 Tax=Parathalassolituus penaei TaxID=2997323 RepID=A0A9X3ISE8_9GAMM|nr:biosynthetic arginine decarboxylase [Parathalassolituus penaei]MCY0965781.1 biosynthetic arginine decarboxylase [Parathalassolituus penaei]
MSTAKRHSHPDRYNLPFWSEGYVRINDGGHLCVHPDTSLNGGLELTGLVRQIRANGLRLPVLVRFPGILHHRVGVLVEAFARARSEFSYHGQFTPVYPIKVNQQQPVVEQIVRGQQMAGIERIGLEAGSKPELIAVLAQARDHKATIVCNGYKDAHFIRLALMGEKMGHQVFLVIEKMSELPLILREADRLGVTPRLGVRARLATVGKGNWQNTGGEKSKFGLSAFQILKVIDSLRQLGKLDALQLLHFHLGSQLANIHDIQHGLRECSRIFAELTHLGVKVRWVDVGGGLGVDYEGTHSRSYCSMNYSMDEYARKVVAAMKDICHEIGAEEPNIISESGRAMTAHHAVLLTEIIDHERPDEGVIIPINEDDPACLKGMYLSHDALKETRSSGALVELYHDVQHWMADAQAGFSAGVLNLTQRARMETLYARSSRLLLQHLNPANRTHRPLIDELNERLAEKVFVNFSLFQSLPDIWGIEQIFPILPIDGHGHTMRHRAVLQDITCDSDGRIEAYVDAEGVGSSLPLPSVSKGEVLAFFMVGAYQEILGDLHNLFGDTDSVDVVADDDGNPVLRNILQGDSVAKVLDYVNFEPDDIRAGLISMVAASDLSDEDKSLFRHELSESLSSYTYLQPH